MIQGFVMISKAIYPNKKTNFHAIVFSIEAYDSSFIFYAK